MSFAIWGFGTALPESSVGQDRAAELINQASGYDEEQSRWMESVYRGAGVGRRHLLMLDHIDEILEHPGSVVPRHTMGWRMAQYEEAIRSLSLRGVEPGPGIGGRGGRGDHPPGHGLLHRVSPRRGSTWPCSRGWGSTPACSGRTSASWAATGHSTA